MEPLDLIIITVKILFSLSILYFVAFLVKVFYFNPKRILNIKKKLKENVSTYHFPILGWF